MSEPYTGRCDTCGARFPCALVHNGFNDSAFAYCEQCGTAGFVSAWRDDIPREAHFEAHGPVSAATESLLAPCSCGGRFRRDAAPRCPSCHSALSATAAASWLEAQAPGAAKGWRWQRSWQGLYSLIVAGRSQQLAWAPARASAESDPAASPRPRLEPDDPTEGGGRWRSRGT